MSLGPGNEAKWSNLDLIPKVKLKKIQTIGPLSVWEVDAFYIRNWIFVDFTEGGNSHAYPQMPIKEIWLDTENEKENKYVLLHELHEYIKMFDGTDYDNAHLSANKVEIEARQHPDRYDELWAKELSKLAKIPTKKFSIKGH